MTKKKSEDHIELSGKRESQNHQQLEENYRFCNIVVKEQDGATIVPNRSTITLLPKSKEEKMELHTNEEIKH